MNARHVIKVALIAAILAACFAASAWLDGQVLSELGRL